MSSLPDCNRSFPESISLNDEERGRLISSIMGKGMQGVDEFIREHEGRGAIGEKIRRLRKELDAQLSSAREKTEDEYAKIDLRMQKQYFSKVTEIDERQQKLSSSTIGPDVIISGELLKFLEETPEKPEEATKPGLWYRIKESVKRFFRRIGNALVRFWDWVRGRKKVVKREREMAVPAVYLPGGRSLSLDVAVDRVFADRVMKARIDGRIKETRPDSLRVRLDEKKYREAAKRIIQEEAERELKRHENEKRRRERDMSRQMKALEDEKRRIRESMDEERKLLQKKKDEDLRNIDRQMGQRPLEAVRNELIDQFETAGYVKSESNQMLVTSRLVDRFAEIIYALEVEGLGSTKKRMINGIGGFGEYMRDSMRTQYEIGKIDIMESLVSARLTHPGVNRIEDDDIMVNRELKGDQFHVVIMFDKSGSMDENGRLLAAKRAALALFKAVKLHNPKNIVDLVAFDSKVKVMDLVELWNCKPEGFTNVGEALNVSFGLLSRSRADRKLVYLITDGLPEAYTSPEGNTFIGDTRTSMQYAVSGAARLHRIRDLKLIMIMLEPKQREYIEAAAQIAAAAEGSVISTDPQELAREMLTDYASAMV